MKLLVSDLDGTLFEIENGKSLGLTERNKLALHKWKKQGNRVLIASARSSVYYEELKDLLNMEVDYIGSNGADILLMDNTRIQNNIPVSVLKAMYDYLEEANIDASIFSFYNNDWHWSSFGKYPSNMEAYATSNRKLIDIDKLDENTNIQKFSILIRKEQRDEMKDFIQNKFGKQVSVVTSDVDKVDVGPLNISKAWAIAKVVDHYGYDFSKVITVGDSDNDIEMFKFTKDSYCISHADDEVKEHASYIVDSVSELINSELDDTSDIE